MQHFPAKLVLGIVGNVTSVALFLSPLPTFWNIYKFRSTQDYSVLPYVCTLFNCALWIVYGTPYVKPHSILILTTNGIGFLLELFYLSSYVVFASKKKKLKTMRLSLAMGLVFAAVVVVTFLAVHRYASRQLLTGTICIVLSVAMYASPLSVMGLVIRTKSVECMPFLLSLFNLINAFVWTAYSVFTEDIFIAIPNGIGSLLGMVQLALYSVYRPSKRRSSSTKAELRQMKPNEGVSESIQNMQEDLAVPTKASSPRFLSPQRVAPRIDTSTTSDARV